MYAEYAIMWKDKTRSKLFYGILTSSHTEQLCLFINSCKWRTLKYNLLEIVAFIKQFSVLLRLSRYIFCVFSLLQVFFVISQILTLHHVFLISGRQERAMYDTFCLRHSLPTAIFYIYLLKKKMAYYLPNYNLLHHTCELYKKKDSLCRTRSSQQSW